MEMLVDAELAFPPGEQYSYGTVNYDVLGFVIEIVSGQSYEDFMREQVFQPSAGWTVNSNQTIIEQSGGNPNFGTEVIILPNERTAVCLLTNGANINRSMLLKVKDILDGNLTQSYEISGTQLLDIILSSTTIILCLLAVLFFFLGLRRRKTNERQPMTKKRIIVTAILLIATIALCIMCCTLDWQTILIWQTYSILTALISSALLTASITWFVYSHRYNASLRK